MNNSTIAQNPCRPFPLLINSNRLARHSSNDVLTFALLPTICETCFRDSRSSELFYLSKDMQERASSITDGNLARTWPSEGN